MKDAQSPTRILIIGQWFVSEENGNIIFPGGTERYVYGLAKQLQKDNYNVHVLSATESKDNTVIKELSTSSFKVPKKRYGYFADFLSFINSIKIIIKFKPDVVHVASTRYRFAVGAVMASKILKKKTVFTLTLILSNTKKKKLSKYLDNILFSKILGKSDVIISLSNEMKNELIQKISSKNIVIIPSFFMDHHYLKEYKEKNSIIFVGRLEIKQKGIDFLIKSLAYVKEKIPEFTLHIIGEGISYKYLEELVLEYDLKDNVIFHGYIEENELIKMYSTCEIFVLPSHKEGMPMVALEALSAGLPIIAFDIEPAIEALDHGKYGILVKKRDVKGLANAIIRLLQDNELKEYYSKMSEIRSKRYSQTEVVRQIEKVYSNLLE